MTASSGTFVAWYEDEYICLHNGESLEGPVNVWEDLETGWWGYRCHCGREIEHDIGDTRDRGSASARMIVLVLGLIALAVLSIGLLGRNLHWIGTGVAGLILVATVLVASKESKGPTHHE